MGGLPEERTGLFHHDHVIAVHLLLLSRDGRMGVGVVGLDAKPTEIFHDVNLHAEVGGRAEIHRFISQVLPFCHQPVFDWVLDVLVEHAHHELFAGAGEELIAQVQVVGHGVFQVGIAFFVVVISYEAIRDDFEETRTVHSAVIGETQVGVFVHVVFQMCAGQPVPIFLVSFGVGIFFWEFQRITLVGVFGTQSHVDFPKRPRIFHHEVSCTDAFRVIVVERVGNVTIAAARCIFNVIEVLPVVSGFGIERITVVEAFTLFIAVESAGLEVHDLSAFHFQLIGQVGLSRKVAVGVMFPTTLGTVLRIYTPTVEFHLHLVWGFVIGFRTVGRPIQHQRPVFQKLVLALERGVENILMVPFQAHFAV